MPKENLLVKPSTANVMPGLMTLWMIAKKLSFCDTCYYDTSGGKSHCTWCMKEGKCVNTADAALGVETCTGMVFQDWDRSNCRTDRPYNEKDESAHELFDVTIEFPIDGHAIFDTFVQMKCAIRARDGTVVSGEEHFCVHLTDGETNSENCLLIKGMSQFPRLDFQSGAYTVISWIEDKDKNVLSPKSSSYFDVVPQEWQAFDIFRGLFSSKPLAIKRGEQLVSSIPAFCKLSQILKSMPMSSLREMVSHHAVSGVTFRRPKVVFLK